MLFPGQNDTMFASLGGPDADCSKNPTPAQATCGFEGLPAVSFKGGSGQPVAPHFIPPWCATSDDRDSFYHDRDILSIMKISEGESASLAVCL
eukprot:SAG11_NODE_660_length_7893_cov_4.055042_5_plen_93_part_00